MSEYKIVYTALIANVIFQKYIIVVNGVKRLPVHTRNEFPIGLGSCACITQDEYEQATDGLNPTFSGIVNGNHFYLLG